MSYNIFWMILKIRTLVYCGHFTRSEGCPDLTVSTVFHFISNQMHHYNFCFLCEFWWLHLLIFFFYCLVTLILYIINANFCPEGHDKRNINATYMLVNCTLWFKWNVALPIHRNPYNWFMLFFNIPVHSIPFFCFYPSLSLFFFQQKSSISYISNEV